MEAQPQMNPTPQIPTKQRSLRTLLMTIGVLIIILCVYYVSLSINQIKRSEELISMFASNLEKDQYPDAYDILESLEGQDLGSHLSETQSALDKLLALKIEDVTVGIVKEKDQNFSTYNQVKELQLFKDVPEVQDIIRQQIKKTTGEYLANKIEYSQIEYFYQNMQELGFSGSTLEESKDAAERCRESRENIKKGQELFAARDYLGALEKFEKVTKDDQETYEIAQIGINQSLLQFYNKIEEASKSGKYAQATEKLQKLQALMPENQEIPQRIAAVEIARLEEEKDLVPYTGTVQHIFFHPLIAYPQLTFDGDSQARGFNEWFVTIPEFQKIIESLYSKGFILIDITDLYEVSGQGDQETIVPKQLTLPKGKKPMVISIDDLNYYRYMVENGTVHKLVLDNDGNIAAYSKNLKGEEIISYDNEIVPILDRFVEEHPDFSFHGAKGVIALTGYEGILGYRTDEADSPKFEQEKKEAQKVVQALKDNGWLFASHSQGHLNVREESYEKLVRDTGRWQKEVQSLIGPTNIYIYPFGASVQPGDPKFKFLQGAGFKVFCSVGPNPFLKYSDQYILMDRRHIDGIALFQQAESLRDLFDSEKVIDPVRPPLD